MWKMVQSLKNYKQYSALQYYWLDWLIVIIYDAIEAVLRGENYGGGIGLVKGREGAWESLICLWFFPPKEWPPCTKLLHNTAQILFLK